MGHPPEQDAVIAAQKAAEAEAGTKPKPRAARKPNPRGKAAAARAEKQQPESKTVTFDGITLTLPDEMPDEILFDMIEGEASNGAVSEYIICLRILRSLVGPDDFMTIRHRIGREPDKVMKLVDDAIEQYGLTLGESEASPNS
jgi:hypothetical protein